MTDDRAGQIGSQLRLLAWLSPAFPVGAFSYSHGLERAVHDGLVADNLQLRAWITVLINQGSGWNDAVLAAESWRRAARGEPVSDVAELAVAMAGSAERHLESTAQGNAFLGAASVWLTDSLLVLPANCSYPVAVGAIAGTSGIELESTLAAYLHAFTSNLVQAAIRLSVIGQTQGVALIAALEDTIAQVARRAAQSSLDELGSATIAAEIASMNHETQTTRLFRS